MKHLRPGDIVAVQGIALRVAWFHESCAALFPIDEAGPLPENLRYFSPDADADRREPGRVS